MLGKLFKYEWKATGKMGLLMLGALAIVTLLGILGFVLPFTRMTQGEVYTDMDSIEILITTVVFTATIMVYIITLMGVVYGMIIYLGIRFYKTMYSDEGYLTLTLPVTPHQLIISKVLNAGLWYSIIYLAMALSVFILIIAMFFAMGKVMNISAVWQEMSVMCDEIWEVMGIEVIHIIVSLILVMLIGPFSAIMILFGSITIGQLASKFRALMGILVYFGVSMLNGVLSYIISFLLTFGNAALSSFDDSAPSIALSYDAALITSVIMLVVFYFVSYVILDKKLNVE